jgi:hypothetical protein
MVDIVMAKGKLSGKETLSVTSEVRVWDDIFTQSARSKPTRVDCSRYRRDGTSIDCYEYGFFRPCLKIGMPPARRHVAMMSVNSGNRLEVPKGDYKYPRDGSSERLQYRRDYMVASESVAHVVSGLVFRLVCLLLYENVLYHNS